MECHVLREPGRLISNTLSTLSHLSNITGQDENTSGRDNSHGCYNTNVASWRKMSYMGEGDFIRVFSI